MAMRKNYLLPALLFLLLVVVASGKSGPIFNKVAQQETI